MEELIVWVQRAIALLSLLILSAVGFIIIPFEMIFSKIMLFISTLQCELVMWLRRDNENNNP